MKKLISLIVVSLIGLAIFSQTPAQAQPIPAPYCCDVYGYHRCVLAQPIPPGWACVCPYQGEGIACY